jgi:hypothetical protein
VDTDILVYVHDRGGRFEHSSSSQALNGPVINLATFTGRIMTYFAKNLGTLRLLKTTFRLRQYTLDFLQ